VEAETHYYNPAHAKLDLGLAAPAVVGAAVDAVGIDRFRDRVIAEHITPDRWRPAT
jgi:hypothetical protein